MSEPSDQTPEESPAEGPGLYRLAWRFYLILAILAVLWIGARHGEIPLALFVDLESWWVDAGLGLAGGLMLVGVWNAGRSFFSGMRRLEEVLAEHIGPLEPEEVYALALISGFAEEIFFRGAIQISWGFVWATVIFTFMHTGPDRAFRWWTLFAFVAALVFGGLTWYRGNVLAAIVAHVVVNAINLRRLVSDPLSPGNPEKVG